VDLIEPLQQHRPELFVIREHCLEMQADPSAVILTVRHHFNSSLG